MSCSPINDPAYSVRLRADVVVERSKSGQIAMSRQGVKFLDVPGSPLLDHLIDDWVTEASIDRLAESEANQPLFYYMCEKLFSLGLLKAQCSIDGKALFVLVPAPDWHMWRETVPASLQGLSPTAYLRQDDGHLVMEMPLSARKCIIHDERCLSWFMEFIQGSFYLATDDVARMAFYRALWLMDALVNDGLAHGPWEFHDLIFFHHSSIGFHDDPVGATWRLKNKLPPAPLFKPITGDTILLPEPNEQLMEKLHTPFAEILAGRRSARISGKRPVTLEELGALLHQSARVQDIREDPVGPCEISLRPSPSGGALHSLEIYPLVRDCSGLVRGAWRYVPAGHRLEAISADKALLDNYLESRPHPQIQEAGPPHIRLVITSRILRDIWKYEKIAYRLVLQDLGCLYQTLSLTATALGLASCILGVVDARRLAMVLKLETLREPVIGEIIISAH